MKFRIILYILLIGIVPVVVFDLFMSKAIEHQMIEHRTKQVESQAEIIINYILSENYFENTTSMSAANVQEGLVKLTSIHYDRIVLIGRNYKILEDSYFVAKGKIDMSERVIDSFQGKDSSFYNSNQKRIEVTRGITSESNDEILGSLVLIYKTEDIARMLEVFSAISYIIKFVIGIIVLIYAVIMAISLVKPFKKVEDSIDMVSGGYYDQQLTIRGYTETEQISEAFNQMIDRIGKLEDSRQEFVSNVSHELKTPITSIKVLADSLIMQENVSPELYKEFLSDIVEEIDRENDIINDLLNLVKMDKTKADLNIQPININELLELTLKRLRPLAAKRNIELVIESFRPVIAEVDETKLMLAVTNLVENAIKYNVLDGWVRLSLNADHKYFYVKISDGGIGISEDEHEKLFDRFYRVDKTRSRETGGTGLGLAITKSVILMHKGAIKVYSKEGEGTTFTVRIPLKYVN